MKKQLIRLENVLQFSIGKILYDRIFSAKIQGELLVFENKTDIETQIEPLILKQLVIAGKYYGDFETDDAFLQKVNSIICMAMTEKQASNTNNENIVMREYVEYDNKERVFGSDFSDGFVTKVRNIRKDFGVRFRYEIPGKSSELGWLGGETKVLLSINGEEFEEYRNTGSQASNASSARMIERIGQTYYFSAQELNVSDDYTIQIKLMHKTSVAKGSFTVNPKDVKGDGKSMSLYVINECNFIE